jgi:hypothetical protein
MRIKVDLNKIERMGNLPRKQCDTVSPQETFPICLEQLGEQQKPASSRLKQSTHGSDLTIRRTAAIGSVVATSDLVPAVEHWASASEGVAELSGSKCLFALAEIGAVLVEEKELFA